jgi:tripartite-type tricarboxylate transporter receptor subunit TctC
MRSPTLRPRASIRSLQRQSTTIAPEVRMRHRLLVLVTAFAALAAPAHAQSFYAGKTLRIVVGLAPGGGFDTYARAIGRHLGKHVPGNPTVIVDNMPGAGSIVLTNHLYKVAKPDGLMVGHFNGAIILGQVLGQKGIEFDARKFEYVGAAVKEDVVCSLTKASGVASVEQWRRAKAPVKLGGVAPGATPDNTARILKAALGLPIQVVTGYKGTSAIRLAVASGELAGACWSWESMRVTWREALEAGEVVPVVQVVPKAFPDIPKVPLAIGFAKTDEARRLIEVGVHNSSAFARPFALPPGTPRERVEVLRAAFQATLQDREFLAEAEKARLAIDPVTGDELGKLVSDVFTLDPALQAKLKAALY